MNEQKKWTKNIANIRTIIHQDRIIIETVTEDGEEVVVIEASEPELTVEDLPGVGPATAEKLREAGIDAVITIGREYLLKEEVGMSAKLMSDRFVDHMEMAFEKWTPRERFTLHKA